MVTVNIVRCTLFDLAFVESVFEFYNSGVSNSERVTQFGEEPPAPLGKIKTSCKG